MNFQEFRKKNEIKKKSYSIRKAYSKKIFLNTTTNTKEIEARPRLLTVPKYGVNHTKNVATVTTTTILKTAEYGNMQCDLSHRQTLSTQSLENALNSTGFGIQLMIW